MKIKRFNIPSLGITDKQLTAMSFGRQIEYLREIAKWKATAQSAWISQKRATSSKAIKAFLSLNNVSEFYCEFHDSESYRDDTFEIFFKN